MDGPRTERKVFSGVRAACLEIRKRFGEQFLRLNARGGNAVAKNVLREFRKISDLDVVWSRSEQVSRREKGPVKPIGDGGESMLVRSFRQFQIESSL